MLRKPVEAALFDMDGLLLDTEVLYIEAMQQAARSLGREMALDFCHSMVGVPARECTLMIEAYYGQGFSIEEFRGRFYQLLHGLLDAGIPLKPGVVELLDFLAGRGLPLAVATSSERRTAERHLSHAGLLDRFTALVTRDDVERPKPHPDIYLEAARRLGAAPERCIAFEDSNIGL
jgi:HAD superfamily hydrolase (TIGR01509 family)